MSHVFALAVQTSASSGMFIVLFDVKLSLAHKLDSHGGRVDVIFVVVFILVAYMQTEILFSLLSAIFADMVMPSYVLRRAPFLCYRCKLHHFTAGARFRRHDTVIVSGELSGEFVGRVVAH